MLRHQALAKIIEQKDRMIKNHRAYCECGNVATVVLNNARICQRCCDLNSRQEEAVARIARILSEQRRWELENQGDNSDVKNACIKWLKARGLFKKRGFAPISFGAA